MKLRPHTYEAWWDLHAWAGVISSLVVYVMFFFGTLTLFHSELRVWEEPRGPTPTLAEVDRIIDQGIQRRQIAPASVRVNFPQGREGFSISYESGTGEEHERFIERGGLVEPRSNAADFLYSMHYLQFPGAPGWLYTAAGLAAGVLLLVVVSGVLIHLRQMVRQFQQFRPKNQLQVVWSDAHKVLGTIGLPFAIVYAFTGAWLALDEPLTARLASTSFHGNEPALSRALRGPPEPTIKASHELGPRLPLSALLTRAEQEEKLTGAKPTRQGSCRSVYLNDLGNREASANFFCGDDSILLWQRDGRRVAAAERAAPTLTSRIAEVPYAMHFVSFAELPLRVLYACLGLAGCLTILTGNWLWLARRAPSRGGWLVQRLTLLLGAGSLVASTSLLLVTRLAISAHFERQVFWGSWLSVGILCGLGKDARRHWHGLVVLAGLSLLSTPLLGLLARDHTYDPWRQVALERGVDVTLLGIGLSLLLLARGLWRGSNKEPQARCGNSEPGAHVA